MKQAFANFTILHSIWESEKFVNIDPLKKKKIEIPFLNTRSIFVNRINSYSKLEIGIF